MPTYTLVDTINTRVNREYDYGVHVLGCRDTALAARKGCTTTSHEAPDADAIIEMVIEDLAIDFGRESAEMFSFRVFPCCDKA